MMTATALFYSANHQRCQEFHLVLQAMRLNSQVVYENGHYTLLVEAEQAQEAYQQLKHYIAENAEADIIAKPLKPLSDGFIGAYLYGLSLLIIGAMQSERVFGRDWVSRGVANSELITNGEWWRTITALGLHGNAAHLVGNIGFGALFGLMVSRYIGSGAAWFSIVTAGAVGNALNAALYQTLHLSIGASTMVFAALGILGVFAINDKHSYHKRGLQRWAPFFATFALLGFLGTTGERTDVMAHLSGYICGCITGFVWMQLLKRTDKDIPFQCRFAVAAIAIPVIGWSLALDLF